MIGGEYLKKLFDATDSTASLRHIAYAGVVAFGVAMLVADFAVEFIKAGHGISDNARDVFGILLAAVTGGKILGAKYAPKEASE